MTQAQAQNVAGSPELAWINANASRNTFAASLKSQYYQKKSLSVPQFSAVTKILAKNAEPKAAPVSVEVVGIERIEKAFASAKESGLKKIKLLLASYTFKPAPANSMNAGAIYVTQGEDYLGKVVKGQLITTRACSDQQRAEVLLVCADPHAAAVAYGKKTGICSCCGRDLTNEESIALGIGPICRKRFGW